MVGGRVNVSAVMDELATALSTIDGLRVFAYFPDRIVPPAAVVDFPELDYDATFGRGADRASFSVYVLVSPVDARSTRDRLLAWPPLVKAAIEAHSPTAYGSARVTRVSFNHSLPVAGVEYAAASFSVDVFGPGS